MNASLGPLLQSADTGDAEARDALFQSLYGELRRLARRELHRAGGLSLGATTLLHETWLKMARRDGLEFDDRGRFMAYAARAMRGLVIDYARRHRALRRGGSFAITSLPTDLPESSTQARQIQRLGEAVEQLAALEPALAEVVDLKYFCGISFVEIAAMRGVSERTVLRDWHKARMLLHRELRD